MRRRSALWGVFMTRFMDALDRLKRRRLSAGGLIGVSGRQFRRRCVRFEGERLEEGLRDRRLGRVSPRRADAAELGRMCGLYRDRHADFSVKHPHEALVREHGCTVTRLALQSAGLVARAAVRAVQRVLHRPRLHTSPPRRRQAGVWTRRA